MHDDLRGTADNPLYQMRLHGGPLDGETSTALRPYFELTINGNCYRTGPTDPISDDYVEWVDDGTRSIDLFYQGKC